MRALKKAETGDEYVVRVYETAGKEAQSANLTFAADIVKAVEADGTEKETGAASFSGNKLSVSIKPFSVKTYRLKLKDNVSEKAGTCFADARSLELPFNKNCFSYNEFRAAGNFEGGLLAASSSGDRKATFTAGKNRQTVNVPYYTGFVGQWGHVGHTKGYLKDAEVAYVGTHSHAEYEDRVYEFTYMFKYGIDIPEGATEIILP